MLRAYALSDLFTANLSAPISGIFLATTSGYLVGLAPSSTPSPHLNPQSQSNPKILPTSPADSNPVLLRKLAILCALTWRFHSSSLPRASPPGQLARPGLGQGPRMIGVGEGEGVEGPSDDLAAQAAKSVRVRPLPVLGQTVDDGVLSGMVVRTEEAEGKVVALGWVCDGLVVGVVGKGSGEGKGKERAEGNGATVQNGGGSGSGSDSGSGSELDEEEASGNGSESSWDEEGEADELERVDEEAREFGRVLSVKADALAEYLRGELKGFKMPKELD